MGGFIQQPGGGGGGAPGGGGGGGASFAGEWEAGATYQAQDCVTHDGIPYYAESDMPAGIVPGVPITLTPATVTMKTPPNAMFGGTDNPGYVAVLGGQITQFPGPTVPDMYYSGNNCYIGMSPRASEEVTLIWSGGPIRLVYNDTDGHRGSAMAWDGGAEHPASQSPLTFTMPATTVAAGLSLTAEVSAGVTSFQWGEEVAPEWIPLVELPASGSTPPFNASLTWHADRAYTVGDTVRYGRGVYKALKAIGAGGNSPGFSAPGMNAVRQAPAMEILKTPITRVYHPGAPWSDITFAGAYVVKVQVVTAPCNLTITNRADNPANRTLTASIYGDSDGYYGSGGSPARGATVVTALTNPGNYYVVMYSDGYLAFDMSVEEAKVTGPDWETIVPGAPNCARWRSADQSVGPGSVVVCDQIEADMAGSYNNGNGIWTAPCGGWWRLEAYMHLTGMTAGGRSYALVEPTPAAGYQQFKYNQGDKRIAQAAADSGGEAVLMGEVVIRCPRGAGWRVKLETGAGTPILKGQGIHYQEPGAMAARFKATFVDPIF